MDNLISTIVEMSGLGIFIFYLIRSLKVKIVGLENTVKIQNETLSVMDKRIHETEKIGDIYKNLISDLPNAIDNYKTILSKTKDETIIELTNQNQKIQNKLETAEKIIEESGNTKENIAIHLKVLKNLLSGHKDKYRGKKEYDLLKITEFNGRSLEDSVSKIVKSESLDIFLKVTGLNLTLTEDISTISNEIFGHKGLYRGSPISDAFATHSAGGGSHVAVNEYIFMNDIRYAEFTREFSQIKNV